MTNIIHVAVAVIMNEDNQVCISLRHKDAHQGGLWEFPGGKIELNETVDHALKREIKEELDLTVLTSRPLITLNYNYPDLSVTLHVQKIQSYIGQVASMEGQIVKWINISQLSDYDFPAANSPIITALQLPERYLITGKFNDQDDFIGKLKRALSNNIRLVQLRLKNDDLSQIDNPQQFIHEVLKCCEQVKVKSLLNLSEAWRDVINLDEIKFSGLHLDSQSLMNCTKKPQGKLVSASCHDERELQQALRIGADFVVLSPVKKTSSHPDMDAIGWGGFANLVENIPIPVYALGGMSEGDLQDAWNHGAQGIAAIGAFWQK